MGKKNPHVLIVEARFYEHISDALIDGAMHMLDRERATYERVSVPGALEIPAAILFAKEAGRFDGYVALGCVIRGETSHYDIVCKESARGLQELALAHGLAIGNGILTVDNSSQAFARASRKEKDKGGAAAEACLRMIELKARYRPS
jgi:6,7-dimethyl-8-ribityllumazine synthase